MDEQQSIVNITSGIFAFIFILFFIKYLILTLTKGVYKTFQRHPIVAIICIIFAILIYFTWAFCEVFTKPINNK